MNELREREPEPEPDRNLLGEGVKLAAREVVVSPEVVACLPAYDEEEHIAKVILRVRRYVDHVIVCDDGSGDATMDIAEALGATVVRHDINQGYGASLVSLFREAYRLGAKYFVTIDADGQHNPDEIPILLDRIRRDDVDIVVGSRFLDGGGSEAPGWRKAGIGVINSFVGNGYHLTDTQSGFRVYSRKAIRSLSLTEDGMGVSTEALIKAHDAGLKVAEVPIHVSYSEKTSTLNPVVHGLEVILSSLKHVSIHHPLTFYGTPGFASILFSLFFWVLVFEEYGRSQALLTNAALLGIGTMLVGLMLVTTAIILWVTTSLIKEQSVA
jgi:glycosyltransferase involved in cell wall biosynthesis